MHGKWKVSDFAITCTHTHNGIVVSMHQRSTIRPQMIFFLNPFRMQNSRYYIRFIQQWHQLVSSGKKPFEWVVSVQCIFFSYVFLLLLCVVLFHLPSISLCSLFNRILWFSPQSFFSFINFLCLITVLISVILFQ